MQRIAPLSARSVQWPTWHKITWPVVLAPLLAVVCAILLWGTSLRGVDLSRMGDLGLVTVLPPAMYAALVLLTVSFCLAVQRHQTPGGILLLHVIVLIVMIHGTPAILEGTLRYAWAWKHVAIVDYIQRHGSVKPDISFLNVYHNWPGLFALGALMTEAAGFKTALSFASWAPVFFNLVDLGALLLILKTLTHDRRLIWLGAWFFYLTNWVGQDYFSPQALAYFLHLVVLGICLGWFRAATPRVQTAIQRFGPLGRAVSLLYRRADRAAGAGPIDASRPLQRVGLMLVIVLLFAVIVSSHQLTPLMGILAVTLLVVFRRCSARSLPILMMGLTLAWFAYMAVAFLDDNLYWVVQSFGQAEKNANSTLIDLSRASPGLRVVAIMTRALTASVWGLAFLGFIRRVRHGYWDLSAAVLAVAPFLMLGTSSYGGEMLFRVYFFALPFMVFFGASLVYPSLAAGTSWRTVALTVALSAALLVGFCFTYYGKERMYYFTPKEVEASQYLYRVAPPGSLTINGTRNYPWPPQNYEHYAYLSLVLLPTAEQATLRRDPVDTIAQFMTAGNYTGAYLIITRSQKAEVDESGVMPPGTLERIERTLMRSRRFKVILANDDAAIFTLAGGGTGQRGVHSDGRRADPAVVGGIGAPIRPAISFWFLLLCPGMAFIRLLRLRDRVTELTLSVALSLALDTTVAEIMVLTKQWSPQVGLVVLISISLVGAALQIITFRAREDTRRALP